MEAYLLDITYANKFHKVFKHWEQGGRWLRSITFWIFASFFMLFNSIIQYFSIGFIFALFSIALRLDFPFDYDSSSFDIISLLENVFLTCVVLTVILSWNIRIEWSENLYLWISIVFGLLIIITILVTIISTFTNILYFI